ncbi:MULTISPECIES: hypothetical protein [Pantoea]|jgi:hypothetical protein|uniref:Uncharacterized protein n=1 Tax=Pantoea brenneri TaxID=472694 RepID=A0A7Y6NH34_9GAMM|nr:MULTISPECIES: hypothetical protein [Pantoea]MBZ6397059.1 hypothetical protein [Pantoea sp.]MBZ6440190.1 hypothetical protein [Pantoea sp.]NUY43448.1 hypothetical protein [Pantoea brenneri]NUY50986.1 hypothetical protein [Pantoea brenneri]NUY61283.1 hypothetical protein [Pantoea brenneri]
MATPIPVDELLANLKALTNDDLTAATLEGNGLFDQMMRATTTHLATQLEKGRITGSDYATVYLGAMQATMQNAVQYLLSRDQSYAQALQLAAQIEATQAQVKLAEQDLVLKQTEQQIQLVNLDIQRQQLEIAKADLLLKQAQLPLAQAQTAQATAQVELIKAQTADVAAKTPLEAALLNSQKAQTDAATGKVSHDVSLVDAQVSQSNAQTQVLNGQVALNAQQTALMKEKVETERGQTLNTRTDGSQIAGIVASQKALQTQQIAAFKSDAKQKGAKILMDTWVTRKTVDDGVAVPSNIDTDSINVVMQNLFADAGLQ